MSVKACGIVLAGGMSRRLGRDKARQLVGGRTLLARVMERLSLAFDETVVVVNDPRRAADLHLPAPVVIAVDAHPGAGPLAGIFAGLTAASAEWGMVVACDMPFLNVELMRHLVSLADGFDAVVPLVDGRPQPTHAAYSKACLRHAERRLKDGGLSLSGLLGGMNVRRVAEAEVDAFDPEHLSFFNVNTRLDLARARALAAPYPDCRRLPTRL